MGQPSDEEILKAVGRHQYGQMTYVIRNILSAKYGMTSTAYIRRRLMAMEKAGLVERMPTNYAVQICWALTDAARRTGQGGGDE